MFYLQKKDSIKYYKSSIFNNPRLIHAFTTRIGGVTPAPLNTFSLGTAGNTDFNEYVQDNRKKICEVLSLDYTKIINPDQKHTTNIKIVSDINDDVSNTDGLITNTKSLVLLLLFADCTPVILFAPKKKVVGVMHAGWKGTAGEIVKKAVDIFEKEFKIAPEEINAAIGPVIGQCCYPVGEDVYSQLKSTVCTNYDILFKNDVDNKVRVDLAKLNAIQLQESGVKNIDILDNCTSCNNDIFYSYRADKGQTGRHAAIASLR